MQVQYFINMSMEIKSRKNYKGKDEKIISCNALQYKFV